MTMTLSPVSMCGVYIGLCLPRMIFATFAGQTAEDHAFGVDDVPVVLDVRRRRGVCLQKILKCLRNRTADKNTRLLGLKSTARKE